MDSKAKIGIIGAGNFGTAIATVIKKNCNEILFYIRTERDLQNSTTSFDLFFNSCTIIFISIPIEEIPKLFLDIKKFLQPHHILVHCVKGLIMEKENVFTVSEYINFFIKHENVACLSGPNLSSEIKKFQLTGAIAASKNIDISQKIKILMNNENFIVECSNDIIGVELGGIMKNIFALASGILTGLDEGDNAKALLMTKGVHEMINISKKIFVECKEETFYSIAGIGDLIATCSSHLSRNFTVGNEIARGKKLKEILSKGVTAEGVTTTKMINYLISKRKIHAPITQTIYKILFEEADPQSIKKIFTENLS